MVEVILREDIPKLGNKGDIVNVKPGYARNYLLPQKLALPATPGTRKQVEEMRAAAARKAAHQKGAAEQVAAQLAELALDFTKRASDQGQLFGSVTSLDIAEALADKGFTFDRRKIEMDAPLKALGEFAVPVYLHREVTARVTVRVLREGGEPEPPPPPEVAAPAEEAVPTDETEAQAAAEPAAEGTEETTEENKNETTEETQR